MEGDRLEEEFEHEQLTVFHDPGTGAGGVIAIHSTVLGPAMGGLRLCGYRGVGDATVDALRLARAMSLKNAAAGLDLGGGKAVLIDDGRWGECRKDRMHAVGREVAALDGRYVTAEDVGTSPADMDVIAEITKHVAGGTAGRGGSGDPSPFTAQTVLSAIEVGVRIGLGRDSLDGVRVGVQGVGHVGAALVELLSAAGAEVLVADIDRELADAAAARFGAASMPIDDFVLGDFDVLAPCALGGAIGPEHVDRLRARVVAGAANNPLVSREVAVALAARGVLYVPDFLANCGGIIHVGAEVLGLDGDEVAALLGAATARIERIVGEAAMAGTVSLQAAEEYAEARIRQRRKQVAR
jgi:glutamate dehydrogenase/leucine dehydrogenase